MHSSHERQIKGLNFPEAKRKVFSHNYLESVVIDLRYPTYLQLKEKEPLDISKSIRKRFPIYEQSTRMQMTPLGTTDPQPVYRFITREKDPILDILPSTLVLSTKKYKSFDDFSSHIEFVIEKAIPHLDTTFFTRVGLRFINKVIGIQPEGDDLLEWINNDLIKPIGGGNLGTISDMKNELSGPLLEGGGYTFRYGISPSRDDQLNFMLDWDYYREDVGVKDCMELLNSFHDIHFPFFWWALGKKAKSALK